MIHIVYSGRASRRAHSLDVITILMLRDYIYKARYDILIYKLEYVSACA